MEGVGGTTSCAGTSNASGSEPVQVKSRKNTTAEQKQSMYRE
jgi:hypothetical protein